MALLDSLARGMNALADKLDQLSETHTSSNDDTAFSIMDKEYCWEDLDYAGNATMQRHVVTGQCRIIDKYGQLLEQGTQEQMEQAMIRRTEIEAAMRKQTPVMRTDSFTGEPVPIFQNCTPVQAQYGDIIGVSRSNGAYEHYGIYVSETCVVHYALDSNTTIHPTIHATSMRHFLGKDTDYFVLDFPNPYQAPVKLGSQPGTSQPDNVSEELANQLSQSYGYHLYTPEETVARARSRIGESSYSLLKNNCEHFAIWCKTGVSESLQVSGMLQTLLHSSKWQFRKKLFR